MMSPWVTISLAPFVGEQYHGSNPCSLGRGCRGCHRMGKLRVDPLFQPRERRAPKDQVTE